MCAFFTQLLVIYYQRYVPLNINRASVHGGLAINSCRVVLMQIDLTGIAE